MMAWALVAAGVLPGAASRAIETIQVLGLFPDRAVVEVDGKRRLLRPGKASPEGVRLVSADSETAVLEFEGHRRTFRLGRRIISVYRPPEAKATYRIWPEPGGMYRANGFINRVAVRFLVDTGASTVAMSRREARRLGIDFRKAGTPTRSVTASGVVGGYSVVLDTVTVGPIELHAVRATIVDSDFPQEVLLGNSFLAKVELKHVGRALELSERF